MEDQSKVQAFVRYVWTACKGVIEVAIVWLVFSRLQGRVEVIVVSILGLIYLNLRSVAFAQGMIVSRLAMGTAQEFLHIRHLLHDNTVDEDDIKMALENTKKTIERATAKGYISMTFIALIWFICLYELFTVLNT
jgi:hypothetical protein